MQVILASSSIHRQRQLQQLGVTFTAHAANIDETRRSSEPPRALAQRLAETKALHTLKSHPAALVIGADQVAELDGEQLRKPLSLDNAVKQLTACSGRRVTFYSGICIASVNLCLSELVTTNVHFRTLSSSAIHAYLKREPAFDCAGSFKSEGLGISLFRSVSSDDPTALIGLPLIATNLMLEQHGYDILAELNGRLTGET